jgi:hypothetical protein
MQKIVKIIALCLLTACLTACDGSNDQPNPAASTSAQQSSQQASVLGGKVSFNIPEELQDQSGKNSSQTSDMTVFADSNAQKILMIVIMPHDSVTDLIARIETQQKMHDSEMTVIKKGEVDGADQKLQRLDSVIKIDGKKNFSSTVLAQVGEQILMMQLTYPVEQQAAGEKAVDSFISSLKIQQ